jgi:hypothetical protein
LSTSAAALAWTTECGSTLHSPFSDMTTRISGFSTRPKAAIDHATTAMDCANVMSAA